MIYDRVRVDLVVEVVDVVLEVRFSVVVGVVGVFLVEFGWVFFGGGGVGVEDVVGVIVVYVVDGGSFFVDFGVGEFFVEGEDRVFGFGVSVVGIVLVGVEMVGVGGGGSSGGRDIGGSGGLRSMEEVVSIVMVRVGVVVFSNGGVRFGDGVERRYFGGWVFCLLRIRGCCVVLLWGWYLGVRDRVERVWSFG